MPENQAISPRIAAVVVTRNRLTLLQECITALRTQTQKLDAIIVINNDSDDGTREWLDSQTDVTAFHQGNLGGAGGFHRGLKEAYRAGHDWFWMMDDDTIAHADALEHLCAAPGFANENAGYLGSVVHWTDGALHKMNMITGNQDMGLSWYDTVLRDKCVPVDVSTFVSILVSRRAVAKVGLPLREYFIWSDDIEYTHRIAQVFPCFRVLDSVVVHKTPTNKDGDVRAIAPGDVFKLRYGLRNQVAFMRKNKTQSLRGVRVAYFIARQIAMILKSRAPLSLIRHLLSGLFFAPKIERVSETNPNPGDS